MINMLGEQAGGPTIRQGRQAVLMWTSDDSPNPTYIHVDVIPSLEETDPGVVTQFPVETGASLAEHVVNFPGIVKLTIAQTNTPFEDSQDGIVDDWMSYGEWVPLVLPETRFRAKGLLWLMQQGEALGAAAATAVTTVLGLAGGGGGQVKAYRYTPPYHRDRIEELRKALKEAKANAREMHLHWPGIGGSWSGYAIQSIGYSRTNEGEIGRFTVELVQVEVAQTGTVNLADPAELRLQQSIPSGGNKPAKAPPTAEADAVTKGAAQEQSAAHWMLN